MVKSHKQCCKRNGLKICIYWGAFKQERGIIYVLEKSYNDLRVHYREKTRERSNIIKWYWVCKINYQKKILDVAFFSLRKKIFFNVDHFQSLY